MKLQSELEFAVEVVRSAVKICRSVQGQISVGKWDKGDKTPVTVADLAVQAVVSRGLHEQFPNDPLMGEEGSEELRSPEFADLALQVTQHVQTVRPDASNPAQVADWVERGQHEIDPNRRYWVLDPVDGTKAFVTGVPLFGTLIALLHRGQPVLGCIHQPVLGQLMVGDGARTMLNGQPVRCRPTRALADATLLCSDWVSPSVHQDGPAFDRLSRRVKLARTWGDCYGYLLLAAGWADVVVDPVMNPWDIAALVPVVRGAGGVITDWNGGPAWPARSTIASATPELHSAVLRTLKS